MPLRNKKPFERKPTPPGLKPDTKVFYLEATKEVFLEHEEFFNRQIELNSTVWSCEYTGKTALTFFEALDSEKEAAKSLNHFPDYLERPILFIVRNFTSRGRFEDLVNDVYAIMKERYFISEEVTYVERHKKLRAKIVGVSLVPGAANPQTSSENQKEQKEVLMPAADNYRYSLQILDGVAASDDGVRDEITSEQIHRSKAIGSRQKVKLFLKNSCKMIFPGGKYVVREKYLEDGVIEGLRWGLILPGMEPLCPQTPVLQRGRTPKTKDPVAADKSSRENGHTPNSTRTPTATPSKSTPNSTSTQKKPRISAKKKQLIKAQQEELSFVFEQAEQFNVDLTNYRQEVKILHPKSVAKLKELVKEAKEEDRVRQKEERKKKQREKLDYNKKRDDLQCDDLKPMPSFKKMELPEWISDDEFSEYLFVFQFFSAYAELLPLEEIRGQEEVFFSEIVTAIRCGDPQNSPYADLMRALLSARTGSAEEEDGDEADLSSREEQSLINLQNCDPIHAVHGTQIREITDLHEKIRKIYGQSVRNLPVDWMTLTESIRLILLTSGYYTGLSTHRHRLFARGNYKGYEDPGFVFATTFPETMEKLKTMTVFDLDPNERLEIMKVIIQQLLSYSKFRTHQEEKHNEILELKQELRKLRAWDRAQEQEAKDARLLMEYEIEQAEKNKEVYKKPSPGKVGLKLRAHLKAVRENRRLDRDDLESILLDTVPYSELDLDEVVMARSLQKEGGEEVLKKLIDKLYSLQARIGELHIGRDRAFRNYFFIDGLPAILVENPVDADHIGECFEATVVNDDVVDAVADVETLTCSGHLETCRVHGDLRNERPHFCFIRSRAEFDELLACLNPRGHRECELADEINYYKQCFTDLVESTEKAIESGEWAETLMLNETDPYQYGNIDWEAEFKDLLLDLEEKIEQGMLGSLKSTHGVDRLEWRRLLAETGDVTSLTNDDLKIGDEVVYTHEELARFDSCQKLAFAFLQLAKCIGLKYIRHPFIAPTKDENGDPALRPAAIFLRWQTAMINATSLSALSLFLSTIEPNILWDKSRLQGKCRKCRRKAATGDLVLCAACDKCYHMACVRIEPAAASGWECTDCAAEKRKKVASEKRKAAREAAIRETIGDEQNDSGADENSVSEDHDESSDNVMRTSSGRAVKRVQYAETNGVSHNTPPLKQSKKNTRSDGNAPASQSNSKRTSRGAPKYNDDESSQDGLEDDDDDDELTLDDSIPRRNGARKRPATDEAHHPQVRHTSNDTKEKMTQLESLLKESMRQETAWPFIEPVDPKEVPDYYDVIKRPMDLRTMMNKMKQRIYDNTDEVCSDFKLMFANCAQYNDDDSEIFQCSQQLKSFVDEKLKKIFEPPALTSAAKRARRYVE